MSLWCNGAALSCSAPRVSWYSTPGCSPWRTSWVGWSDQHCFIREKNGVGKVEMFAAERGYSCGDGKRPWQSWLFALGVCSPFSMDFKASQVAAVPLAGACQNLDAHEYFKQVQTAASPSSPKVWHRGEPVTAYSCTPLYLFMFRGQ